MKKLFVYGTLRQRGEASSLMLSSRLVATDIKLSGYSLYNYRNLYPFAIKTNCKEDFIVGDVFNVSESDLQALDEYEGEMYTRIFDSKYSFCIYVAEKIDFSLFPRIISGNWFEK